MGFFFFRLPSNRWWQEVVKKTSPPGEGINVKRAKGGEPPRQPAKSMKLGILFVGQMMMLLFPLPPSRFYPFFPFVFSLSLYSSIEILKFFFFIIFGYTFGSVVWFDALPNKFEFVLGADIIESLLGCFRWKAVRAFGKGDRQDRDRHRSSTSTGVQVSFGTLNRLLCFGG